MLFNFIALRGNCEKGSLARWALSNGGCNNQSKISGGLGLSFSNGASSNPGTQPSPAPTATPLSTPVPTATPVSTPNPTPNPSPNPTPNSTPSCTPLNFVSGSISPNQVTAGGNYTISCNYGSSAQGTSALTVSNMSSCQWASWNGNSSIFNCTASTTPGTYPLSCVLLKNSPSNFCSQTNSIGNLIVVAAPSPTPTPAPTAAPTPNTSPTITWGSPINLFTAGQIGEYHSDSNPGTVMIDSTNFKWFVTGGSLFDLFEGPSTQPIQTTLTKASSVPAWITMNGISGIPWIVGTYKDDNTGNIYGIIHLELRPYNSDGSINWSATNWYSRLGIAKSTNGGLTWNLQGLIVTQFNETPGGENTNVAGSGIVVRPDGYMYIWYNDGGPSAIARASLSNVYAGNTSSWFKYYNGSYSQPGLGGNVSTIANVWVGRHSSVSYNTYINQFMIARDMPLTIYLSTDGFNWKTNSVVTPDDGGTHWYSVITSPGYKEGTSGQNFDVTYWNATNPQSTSDQRVLRRFSIK